jgi:cephalosporin-C deacetylase-like acetyl esterase
MKKIHLVIASMMLFTTAYLNARPAKPVDGYLFKINTNHKNAVFKVDEKIKFEILLNRNGKPVSGKAVSYTIDREGQKNLNGKITSAAKAVNITTSLNRPGFILLKAVFKTESGKTVVGYAGAGIEPLKIKTPKISATDLKAVNDFWNQKIKMLKALPLKVKMIPATTNKAYKGKLECFDIRVNCPGGLPVSGYYLKPVNAKSKSLPAYVVFHGAGVRSADKHYNIAAKGALTLDVNAHGIDNGKSKNFYQELRKGKLKGYPYFNSNNREKSYFCGMMMRVYRALQFIKSRPEWNGKTLIVYGSSQGGAQTLFATAVDPDITFAVARVPAMCNHYGIFDKRVSGWPRFIKMKSGEAVDPKVVETSKYYDMTLLAPRIKAEMLLTAGFIDRTCCPSSVYCAYNAIKSPKNIINNIPFGHYNPPETTRRIYHIIDAKLKK